MRKTHSNRFWILLLGAAFAACAAAALLTARAPAPKAAVARVIVDGEIVREIDLSAIAEEETFTIETGAVGGTGAVGEAGSASGTNVIAVRPGGIRVSWADCPDQVCVRQGWLTGGKVPIVCLPHRLVIEIVSGGDPEALDAVAG